jgi:hypothetical protein
MQQNLKLVWSEATFWTAKKQRGQDSPSWRQQEPKGLCMQQNLKLLWSEATF